MFTDKVKSVSVMLGDSLSLHPDVTDVQNYDVICWRFQHGISPLAELSRKTGNVFIRDDHLDERFRNKLKLDIQTGSLTIKNTRMEQSGLYEVEITSTSTYTIHQIFTVTVSGEYVHEVFMFS